MTTLDDEYTAALEFIQSAPSGREVLDSLRPFSEAFVNKVEAKLSGPAAQMVFSLLGREEVNLIIYKNCVLFASRLLARARTYDGLSPRERLDPLISFLSAIASRSGPWAERHEAASHPIHDKKERTKRRHLAAQEERTLASHAARLLIDALWNKVVPLLLPNGTASLYLPKGGAFLIPFIESQLKSPFFIPLTPEQTEETVRVLKVTATYWLFDAIRRRLNEGSFAVPRYLVPEELVSVIEPLLMPLRTAFLPADLPIDTPMQLPAAASCVAQALLFLIQSFSLEAMLTLTWLTLTSSSGSPLHTEHDLEALVDALSLDERPIRTLLSLATPTIELGGPGKDLTSSFFGLLMQGLSSTVKGVLVEDALSSFDWEGAQRTVLDRLRWFFLSPYADEAIAAWLAASDTCAEKSPL